jgi:hypothetical protein
LVVIGSHRTPGNVFRSSVLDERPPPAYVDRWHVHRRDLIQNDQRRELLRVRSVVVLLVG